MASERRKLAERVFELEAGKDLGEWVAERRDPKRDGGKQSWRRIAQELYDDFGIEVTDVTLINWFGDRDREGTAA